MGVVEVYLYHTPFFANYILRLTPHLSVKPLLCANHVQYPPPPPRRRRSGGSAAAEARALVLHDTQSYLLLAKTLYSSGATDLVTSIRRVKHRTAQR